MTTKAKKMNDLRAAKPRKLKVSVEPCVLMNTKHAGKVDEITVEFRPPISEKQADRYTNALRAFFKAVLQ